MGSRRHTPPSLSRRAQPRRAPKLRLKIFCEGALTEPAYFQGLARAVGNGLVEITFEPGAGVPMTLVRKAIAEKKRKGRPCDSFEAADQIWVVFDRDEHPDISQARGLATQHKIGVAFSNPCFELWALLHFLDHDAPIHRHDAQRELGKIMPGYDRRRAKSIDLELMLPHTAEASKRAVRMRGRRADEQDPLGCPYTDVDILADLISKNGKS